MAVTPARTTPLPSSVTPLKSVVSESVSWAWSQRASRSSKPVSPSATSSAIAPNAQSPAARSTRPPTSVGPSSRTRAAISPCGTAASPEPPQLAREAATADDLFRVAPGPLAELAVGRDQPVGAALARQLPGLAGEPVVRALASRADAAGRSGAVEHDHGLEAALPCPAAGDVGEADPRAGWAPGGGRHAG